MNADFLNLGSDYNVDWHFQEKIVKAGGLQSLLTLLESTVDETCRRVAAGALANLAMNETNQELIMNAQGVHLLVGVSGKH